MECRRDEAGRGWNVEEIGRQGMECRRDEEGRGWNVEEMRQAGDGMWKR
jgi:ribosomal protein L13E